MGKSHPTVWFVALLIAGCGGSKQTDEPVPERQAVNVVQPGAPGEPSRTVDPNATPVVATHTKADVEFMQGMIHHHQQALTMTDWVPDRTNRTTIRLLAKRMALSQEAEIEQMRTWLKDRGVDPDDHSHAHTAMPGMLNSSQLDRLKTAEGTTFDARFLRYMTQHHRGALTMVGELQAKGGGAEAEINAFTRHVDADQASEILRMQRLLTGL